MKKIIALGFVNYIFLLFTYICILLINKYSYDYYVKFNSVIAVLYLASPIISFFMFDLFCMRIILKCRISNDMYCKLIICSTLIADVFSLISIIGVLIVDYLVVFDNIATVLSPIFYSIISIIESIIAIFIYYVKYT